MLQFHRTVAGVSDAHKFGVGITECNETGVRIDERIGIARARAHWGRGSSRDLGFAISSVARWLGGSVARWLGGSVISSVAR
jgi:hypothetical protein